MHAAPAAATARSRRGERCRAAEPGGASPARPARALRRLASPRLAGNPRPRSRAPPAHDQGHAGSCHRPVPDRFTCRHSKPDGSSLQRVPSWPRVFRPASWNGTFHGRGSSDPPQGSPVARRRARPIAGAASVRSLLRRTGTPALDDPAARAGRWSRLAGLPNSCGRGSSDPPQSSPVARRRARPIAGAASVRSLLRRTGTPALDDPAARAGRWSRLAGLERGRGSSDPLIVSRGRGSSDPPQSSPVARRRARPIAGAASVRSLLRRTGTPALDDPAARAGRWSRLAGLPNSCGRGSSDPPHREAT